MSVKWFYDSTSHYITLEKEKKKNKKGPVPQKEKKRKFILSAWHKPSSFPDIWGQLEPTFSV